jgi:hypothetical protein
VVSEVCSRSAASPTLAAESCLDAAGGAALGPWLTALTALQTLDLQSKARCIVVLVLVC